MSEVDEYDIWLTPHDMDHLRDGAPVFKGIGEDVSIILRAGDWDTIERVNQQNGEGSDQ